MKRLIIAAAGLASGVTLAGLLLVAQVTVHQEAALAADTPTATATATATVARTATATATATATVARTATATATATPTPVPQGSGCYTNWNSASCATGWTAVSVGEWTAVTVWSSGGYGYGGTMICAAHKPDNDPGDVKARADSNSTDNNDHLFVNDPCAVCCGATAAAASSPFVVGGFQEPPDLVTRTGASGMGGGTYAVLGGLALAGLGILAVKRRGVQ